MGGCKKPGVMCVEQYSGMDNGTITLQREN